MSVDIIPVMSKGKMSEIYTAEWTLENLSSMEQEVLQTPSFYPIPDVNLKFCFDIWYEEVEVTNNGRFSSFKLALVKLFEFQIPSDLKLHAEVAVFYSDGTIFKEYKQKSIGVKEITRTTCIKEVTKCITAAGSYTSHWSNIRGRLTLKCDLTFYDHLNTASEYSREMCSLKNLKTFAQGFSAIYEHAIFSDVTFRIGNETLIAQKSILAAHSPVFMKMFTNDFVESKSNSITITDCDIDIFKYFLKYLYSGTIDDVSWSTLKDLYILADKYHVEMLKRECVAEIVTSELNMEQICEILSFAYEYDDKNLKFEAKKFAAGDFKLLICKAEWTALVASNPLIGYEVIAYSYSIPITE